MSITATEAASIIALEGCLFSSHDCLTLNASYSRTMIDIIFLGDFMSITATEAASIIALEGCLFSSHDCLTLKASYSRTMIDIIFLKIFLYFSLSRL